MTKEQALNILIQVANGKLNQIAGEHKMIQDAVKVVAEYAAKDMVEKPDEEDAKAHPAE